MKHIAFKTVPLTNPAGTTGELNYRVYIELAIRQPLDGKSIGADEMHKSVRLLNFLEKATGDEIDLEDADFDFLCLKVRAMKFNWADPAFEQFMEDVTKGE